MEQTQQTRKEGNIPAASRVWKTGLLLVTSALFGGLAVAFWHRRTLSAIREAAGQELLQRAPGSEDDVIY